MQSLRSVLFNLRKPNFGPTTSVSFFSPHVSRVCFTSASNYSKAKHASEETDNSYTVDEAVTYVGDESSELQGNAKDRMGDQQVNKKVDRTTNQVENTKYEPKQKPQNMKQSATGMAANKAGEGIHKAADMVKSTTEKTVDAVNSVAEKAKNTIKESVSGTSSIDNVDDLWEDHTGKPKDHTEKPNPRAGKK